MSSLIDTYFDSVVTLYRVAELDERNEPEYAGASVRCRLVPTDALRNDPNGNEVMCNTVMLTTETLNPATDYVVFADGRKALPVSVKAMKAWDTEYYEVYLR